MYAAGNPGRRRWARVGHQLRLVSSPPPGHPRTRRPARRRRPRRPRGDRAGSPRHGRRGEGWNHLLRRPRAVWYRPRETSEFHASTRRIALANPRNHGIGRANPIQNTASTGSSARLSTAPVVDPRRTSQADQLASNVTKRNGILLCRHHHRAKRRDGWWPTLHDDGTVTWAHADGRSRVDPPPAPSTTRFAPSCARPTTRQTVTSGSPTATSTPTATRRPPANPPPPTSRDAPHPTPHNPPAAAAA